MIIVVPTSPNLPSFHHCFSDVQPARGPCKQLKKVAAESLTGFSVLLHTGVTLVARAKQESTLCNRQGLKFYNWRCLIRQLLRIEW